MMVQDKIKVTICYRLSNGDEELFLQSLRTLPILREKHPNFEINVAVIHDCDDDDELDVDDDSDEYRVYDVNFRCRDYCILEDLFKFYDSFDSDYIVELNCDVALFTLESVEAMLRRARMTLKENLLGMTFSVNGGLRVLGKAGIKQILQAFSNPLIRKRLSMRRHAIDDVIDVLMEMCNVIINKFDTLEGIKGHCIEGVDNLDRATSIGFHSDAKAMKIYLDDYLSKTYVLPLETFIKDKTVAIVGNADVDKDYSEEIDAHDVVIRVNNFYNYDSGKVGKKVSALLLSGTSAWMNEAPKGQSLHEAIISEKKPLIFLLTETSNQKIERLHSRYDGCERVMLGNKTSDLRYTSGTVLLKMIDKVGGYSKISLYGFDKGDKWKNYVNNHAIIHDEVYSEEEVLRMELFKKFSSI